MYFITFSRMMGAHGPEIARRVADQLGYNFYDTEAIEKVAREMGFLKDVKEADEKVPSLYERVFSHRPEIHLDRLHSVIYELASRGDAVFLGRGSHILLRAFKCALHIRVIASLEKRIQHLEKRGLVKGEAIQAIRISDHERGAFIKLAFGLDWDNPELYDIILNMDNLTVDLAVDTVLHMARTEEIRDRSRDVMKSLEMMGLVRRAEAALLEAELGYPSNLVSISVLEPGKIRLTGFLEAKWDKERVERILKGVKGLQSIDNQTRIRPAMPPPGGRVFVERNK